MRLVLFDVDGTLLSCGPQVRPLFGAALEEVFGEVGALEGHDFAGKTDPRSVVELMTSFGREEAEVRARLPAVREAFARHLEAGLRHEEMCLLPGVVELLESLTARDDLRVGLLTGNWETSGRIKLSRFGLNEFFGFGAFGDDAEERRDLVPVALERARRISGRHFAPEATLIVGDTPRDVDCGRAHGVPTLAVATGFTPAEDLSAAGADWVATDLRAAGEGLAAWGLDLEASR